MRYSCQLRCYEFLTVVSLLTDAGQTALTIAILADTIATHKAYFISDFRDRPGFSGDVAYRIWNAWQHKDGHEMACIINSSTRIVLRRPIYGACYPMTE